MIVTIWRHGEAGRASRDELRELTGQGRADVARGSSALRAICHRKQQAQPDRLWYSRWTRTTQTASLVQQEFQEATQSSQDALIPGALPSDVQRELEGLWHQEVPPCHLILVSHQPLVSALTDYLLGEVNSAPPHSPGGLVSLHLSAPGPGCASLLWWAFPPGYEAVL